jgi:hypothetical protein
LVGEFIVRADGAGMPSFAAIGCIFGLLHNVLTRGIGHDGGASEMVLVKVCYRGTGDLCNPNIIGKDKFGGHTVFDLIMVTDIKGRAPRTYNFPGPDSIPGIENI